jgi:aldose sugar dehydrogenase
LEVGPDGYLYVVSLGQGKIFRIVPGDADPSILSPPIEESISPSEVEQEGQDPVVEGQEEDQQEDIVNEEENNDEEED